MEVLPKSLSRATSRRFDSLEQEAYLSVWRTYDRLRVLDEAVFAEWGLTAQQYNLLRLLRSESPGPVATLSLTSRLVSRAPDITRMIDRLEENGWIQRMRSATDRRTVLVSITESGLKLLQDMAQPLADCHDRQLSHLSESELRNLCDLLSKARLPHESADSPWK